MGWVPAVFVVFVVECPVKDYISSNTKKDFSISTQQTRLISDHREEFKGGELVVHDFTDNTYTLAARQKQTPSTAHHSPDQTNVPLQSDIPHLHPSHPAQSRSA